MKNYFERVFAHRCWANQQTLMSVLDCPAAHAEATSILAHLSAAEHIWLSRLLAEMSALPVWPPLSLDQCKTLITENNRGWDGYISGLTDEALHAEVAYQNSRGEPFRNSVVDVLTHVINHGHYHRGQIAKVVGRAGGKTAVTDFIVFVRLGNPAAG